MPSKKSSVVTEVYMIGIMEGKVFCPKIETIKLKCCPCPPKKDILLAKVFEAMRKKGVSEHGIDRDHLPDSKWLLAVLSTIAPEDEIFKKNYRPPLRS